MHEDIDVSPEFKVLSPETLAQLPKVVLWHPVTVENAAAELRRLADDAVVYAELRLATTSEDELHQVLHLLDSAPLTARVVLSATSPKDVPEAIELAAQHRGAVVGFAFEGEARPTTETAVALKQNFLPFAASDVRDAVTFGADRITGALDLYEDFSVDVEGIAAGPLSAYVRDREVALEMSLSADDLDDIGDHPLPLLQQLGFTCTFNPRQASVNEEFGLLVDGFDYGLEELFDFTVNAIEAAFAPIELRRAIMQEQIAPVFQKFADQELLAD
ncbi:hypothetical protein [Corynebacterium sp. H130]|uniref:hypothetical protein n=1 Tax=Corynebacterium sp. H130 TaxID=3133444 RepID=UPI0030B3B226